MMRYNALQTLARISVPVLVVAGDGDPVTKPEATERIHSSVPRARLVTLAPAKDLGLIEHDKKYAEVVREFAYAVQAESRRGARLASSESADACGIACWLFNHQCFSHR